MILSLPPRGTRTPVATRDPPLKNFRGTRTSLIPILNRHRFVRRLFLGSRSTCSDARLWGISSSMTVRLFTDVHTGLGLAYGAIRKGERGQDACSLDSSISQAFGCGRSNDKARVAASSERTIGVDDSLNPTTGGHTGVIWSAPHCPARRRGESNRRPSLPKWGIWRTDQSPLYLNTRARRSQWIARALVVGAVSP